MLEIFAELERKLSEEYPYGPTEKELDVFCKSHKVLCCSKRRKQFMKIIFSTV